LNGTVNEVNVDEGRLKVLVNISDRETLVDLGFNQVGIRAPSRWRGARSIFARDPR
jgi:hypothetical protein